MKTRILLLGLLFLGAWPTVRAADYAIIPSAVGAYEKSDHTRWAVIDVTGRTVHGTTPVAAANLEAALSAAGLTKHYPSLAAAKAAKLEQINAHMAAEINAGVTVAGQTYGITDADQAQWIAALTALANAQTVAGFDPDTQDATALLGPLLNKAGQPVGSVTVSQFRSIMAALTQAIGGLRVAHMSKLAALQAADTIAEVAAIAP